MINAEEIKKEIANFLKIMGFGEEVRIEEDRARAEEVSLRINLRAEEPELLIGEKGLHLMALECLVKRILKKKDDFEPFILDVNDYRKGRMEFLKDMARSLADQVELEKKEAMLQPMNAFERRVIHLELSGRTRVVTESIGEEPERRVVIRPV